MVGNIYKLHARRIFNRAVNWPKMLGIKIKFDMEMMRIIEANHARR